MSSKVNVKTLKARLTLPDYETIIKALKIPIVMQTKERWILMTGCHNVQPLLGSNKLYFFTDNKIFTCFTKCACSFDIISLVQKRKSLLKEPASFMDAINFILLVTGIDPSIVERKTNAKVYDWESQLGKYIRFKQTGTDLEIYDKDILDTLEKSLPVEWLEEGISAGTLRKYQISYYRRLNQICIPVFDCKSNLMGIRCRNMRPDFIDSAKYIPLTTLEGKTYKFNTNRLFFGANYNKLEIENRRKVVLVESEKAVMKADTFYNNKSITLGLFGSQLGTYRRNEILKMGVEEVILALDSDFHEVGDEEYKKFEEKMLKLAQLFKGFCNVSVIYNNLGLEGYKASPLDFDKEVYESLYENREIIEWKE